MVTIGMNVAMNGYDYENSSVHRMLEFAGGGGVGERENHNSIDCLNPFGGNKMLFLKIAPQC